MVEDLRFKIEGRESGGRSADLHTSLKIMSAVRHPTKNPTSIYPPGSQQLFSIWGLIGCRGIVTCPSGEHIKLSVDLATLSFPKTLKEHSLNSTKGPNCDSIRLGTKGPFEANGRSMPSDQARCLCGQGVSSCV